MSEKLTPREAIAEIRTAIAPGEFHSHSGLSERIRIILSLVDDEPEVCEWTCVSESRIFKAYKTACGATVKLPVPASMLNCLDCGKPVSVKGGDLFDVSLEQEDQP